MRGSGFAWLKVCVQYSSFLRRRYTIVLRHQVSSFFQASNILLRDSVLQFIVLWDNVLGKRMLSGDFDGFCWRDIDNRYCLVTMFARMKVTKCRSKI